MKSFIRIILGLLVLLIAGAGIWLAVAPPDLVRVATNYAAKMVCSNVYVAGRNADDVIADDLKAPGHPIFGAITVSVDKKASPPHVTAQLLGLFGEGKAIYRGEKLGCSSVPGDDFETLQGASDSWAGLRQADKDVLWPGGEKVELSQNPEISDIIADDALVGPGMRAVVIVHNGRIIGERYGAGFSADTPLLGWSMTKTVTAVLIGILVKQDKLGLDQTALFDEWTGDDRKGISLASMLEMSSGLAWNEGYGSVSDVTRMLYLESDMAGFASGKAYDPENGNPEDDRLFNYSSGTSVMLSNVWMRAADDPVNFPWQALFEPLGMKSAVLEADAEGRFAGSSYLYATARDWARFGQLLLQRGAWDGRSILPSGYVDWLRSPASASMAPWGRPEYGRHVWLHGPGAGTPKGEDPDQGFDLPDDTFWMLGHDGQSVAISPSNNLVIVRMGLTPSDRGYKPQGLLEAIVKAVSD